MNSHILSAIFNIASVMFVLLSLAIVVNTFFRIRKLRRMQSNTRGLYSLPSMKLSQFDEIKIMSTNSVLTTGEIFHHSIMRNTGPRNGDLGLAFTFSDGLLSSSLVIQKEALATRSVNGKGLVHG